MVILISILEQTFTLYDKDYWARNEYPYWNKDHISRFYENLHNLVHTTDITM